MATQLSDGRWQARYRPKNGEPRVWHGDTEAEAEAQKAQYLRDLERPLAIRSTGETLLDAYAMNAWWPTVVASTGDGTQKRYSDDWRKHVGPRFGDYRLNEVSYEMVQGWVAEMRVAGVPANTIRARRAVLSMVLNLAVKNGLILRNPAGDVKIAKAPKRIRVITLEKATEVLRYVWGTNMAAPVFLALFLGGTRGEVAGLKWSSIDMKTRRVRIFEQRRRIRQGPFRMDQTDPKKEARIRSFILPHILFEILLKVGNLDSEWVCTGMGRRPANPEHMSARWKVISEELGLDEWTFHDLRHGAAGLLAELGLDLLTIASILGHSDVDTTKLYAAAQERSANRGLEMLGDALLPHLGDNLPQVASTDATPERELSLYGADDGN